MLAKPFLLTTLVCVMGVALSENSPVFLWGANSPALHAMHTVTQRDFAAIIAPLLKDNMVVAFQEEHLTTKDFRCFGKQTSRSCYAYLSGVTPYTYYPSVENPLAAVRSLTNEPETNNVGRNGQLAMPIECTPGKLVIVNFESTTAARSASLEAHDTSIAAITRELNCPVVYLYMSPPTTTEAVQHRVVRSTAAASGGHIFRQGSQFLLFYTKLSLKAAGKTEAEEIVVNSMTITNGSNANSQFSVSLQAANGKALSFDITLSGGYFAMSKVAYDGIKFLTGDVAAPIDFSYFCGNLTLASATPDPDTPVYRLHWNSLQFQAPFGSTKKTDFVFGSPWHCVGFFSPAILMGLFTVALMLAIVFTGICWMVDINTMDRFDDPKGKTITINASE